MKMSVAFSVVPNVRQSAKRKFYGFLFEAYFCLSPFVTVVLKQQENTSAERSDVHVPLLVSATTDSARGGRTVPSVTREGAGRAHLIAARLLQLPVGYG